MKRTCRAVAGSLALLSTALGAASLGCSHPQPPTVPPSAPAEPPRARAAECPPPASPPFESNVPQGSPAQRRAQQAWCSYLEALYHRATQDGANWPELPRCNAQISTASPEMLERTAVCSKRALEGFAGDPFTEAYAAEVKRCGTTVLEAVALTPDEVEPYVSLICEHASICSQGEPAECRSDVNSRLGRRIARAVGALNPESRLAFRQCLQAAACQGVEERIAGCLEPILERLLWTPG